MTPLFFKSGSWNALCDVCGHKFKSHQMRKRWDGLMVCEQDFEHDHPQKFLRVREDKIAVPWVRSRQADLELNVCTLWTSSAYADFGTADCAVVGRTPTFESLIELFRPGTASIAEIAIAGYAMTGVA
jgi:hypothetical protein